LLLLVLFFLVRATPLTAKLEKFYEGLNADTPLSAYEDLFVPGAVATIAIGDSPSTNVKAIGVQNIQQANANFFKQGKWRVEPIIIDQHGSTVTVLMKYIGTYPDGKPGVYTGSLFATAAGEKISRCTLMADFGSLFANMKAHGGKAEL